MIKASTSLTLLTAVPNDLVPECTRASGLSLQRCGINWNSGTPVIVADVISEPVYTVNLYIQPPLWSLTPGTALKRV